MTEPSILELARQGDANAIATLMNRQLQSKDITAKVVLKDSCLQVIFYKRHSSSSPLSTCYYYQ